MTVRTAADLAAGFADGSLTPSGVIDEALETAGAATSAFATFASLDPDGARAAACESDDRWAAGSPLGPLDGVPISFKDSFHVAGLPRWHGTAASPGPLSAADCAPVRRAREAGMVVLGKTTMPDYAMLMAGLSSQHGTITNPWDPATNTSGSSAGAGPSVVTGATPIAVGTDMIGSVRLPAAVCGLASIKPTQGRIAYDPAGSYRSAGPMAATVDDVEAALVVLGQEDVADRYCLPGGYEPAPARLTSLAGRRFLSVRGLSFGTPLDDATMEALARAEALVVDLGGTVEAVDDLPVDAADHDAVYWSMIYLGLPDHLSRSTADRARALPRVAEMLEGASSQSATFAALAARRLAGATEQVRALVEPFDHVLSPVLPARSFPASWLSTTEDDPVAHMGFTCWFNQLGTPAGTVPVLDPGDAGVPVSVQVTGQRFADGDVLDVLRLLERDRGFTPALPGLDRAPTTSSGETAR
ncbi:amidase family protein [Nocardioides bruguierae]|uniref:Amidase family protein n=1 Tax=Nocardioides bruguierae TaxID=2945102 RepID=A0A9X2DAQ0_9ACTN|nr:amidase family protein [Nocardioides bruguierae]MCM0622468.1 amidase family protein [Nocardioides bruguierae]